MSTESTDESIQSVDNTVTWVITHRVRRGKRPEFEEWLSGVSEVAHRFKGA